MEIEFHFTSGAHLTGKLIYELPHVLIVLSEDKFYCINRYNLYGDYGYASESPDSSNSTELTC